MTTIKKNHFSGEKNITQASRHPKTAKTLAELVIEVQEFMAANAGGAFPIVVNDPVSPTNGQTWTLYVPGTAGTPNSEYTGPAAGASGSSITLLFTKAGGATQNDFDAEMAQLNSANFNPAKPAWTYDNAEFNTPLAPGAMVVSADANLGLHITLNQDGSITEQNIVDAINAFIATIFTTLVTNNVASTSAGANVPGLSPPADIIAMVGDGVVPVADTYQPRIHLPNGNWNLGIS